MLQVTENGKVVTCNGKFSSTLFPHFTRDHIDSVDCALGYKSNVGRRSSLKGVMF